MLRDMIESVCELDENEETSQDIPRVTGKLIGIVPELRNVRIE